MGEVRALADGRGVRKKSGWFARFLGRVGAGATEPVRPALTAAVVADPFDEGQVVVARLRALGLEPTL